MNHFQAWMECDRLRGCHPTVSRPPRITFFTTSVVLAAAIAWLGLASTPADAAPSVAGASSPSTFFAGYTVTGANGAAITSDSTAFTVPTVLCPPATAPNSGDFLVTDVAAANSSTFAQGGVVVICDTGHLRLQAQAIINNFRAAAPFIPAPRDRITVAVSQTPAGARVIINDITQHSSLNTTGPAGAPTGGSDNTSATGTEAITMNDAQVGNAPFGTVAYSKDLTNRVAIGTLPHTAFNEVSPAGTLQLLASPLNAAGNAFRTTFKHN